MRLKSIIFITLVFLVSPVFFFISTDGRSQMSILGKSSLTKRLFAKGEALYQKQCVSCHGLLGAGDGKAAYLLYPKPRDFTRGEFRLISTNDMTATHEDLFKTITRGMPGSAMPPWEYLNEGERWGLVYYVRYLTELGKKRAKGEISEEQIQKGLPWEAKKQLINVAIDPESVIRVPNKPPVSDESLARGRELFVKACASCHGPQGKGDGQQIIQDGLGYPLKPRDLTAGIFKGASSSEELYYRIAAGLPGSPMPSYSAALTEEQIWDLIHYVQTLPKPGAEERARLHHLEITAHRTQETLTRDPVASYWAKVEPIFVSLTPLWWRDDRVEGVEVRALHDGNQLAILLSWKDPTQDDSTVTPQSFSDGAALQFSMEKEPPFFAMGSSDSPVFIWHWKASWQKDFTAREDIETAYPNTATDWYESQTNYEHGSSFETRDSKTEFHDPLFITGWGAGNPL
ncbi:MAG: c-type cytochrome, partial [Candidatus Omnitrophica bacterium]|nr:c-type cytochrome [Candidatus Omnitrophota bacterium]